MIRQTLLSLSILLGVTAVPTLSLAQEKPAIAVNGVSLSMQEYYRRMEYLQGVGRVSRNSDFVELFPAIATIDTVITELLMLQVAKERGVLPTEAEIDFEVGYRSRLSPKIVDSWIASGRTMPEYRQMIKVEIAQFKLQTQGQTVTPGDIEDLYNLSKDTLYTSPSRVKLRIITVRTAEAQSTVDAEFKAGKSFQAIAALYSTDLSSKDGGLFGEVPMEALSEPVRKAITNLKKGERTEWISAGEAYAKFLVEEIIPKSVQPLTDDIREDLKRQILVRKSRGKNDVAKMLREARAKAKIEISNPKFDQAYKSFIESEQKRLENSGGASSGGNL